MRKDFYNMSNINLDEYKEKKDEEEMFIVG